ncbi:hypothetical protein [Micromonospora aurantiaca (nom. illeg.)]|uniref:hypothetical protein n=1 Tax=Micromonospora aurantiaca (nom. illeg.) TaxID=47850 RepID=UPI0033DD99F3
MWNSGLANVDADPVDELTVLGRRLQVGRIERRGPVAEPQPSSTMAFLCPLVVEEDLMPGKPVSAPAAAVWTIASRLAGLLDH